MASTASIRVYSAQALTIPGLLDVGMLEYRQVQ